MLANEFNDLRKQVEVVRFIINNSIEMRMLAIQKRKTAIAKAAANGHVKEGTTEQDFKDIFDLE